jgi:hypothetical protein
VALSIRLADFLGSVVPRVLALLRTHIRGDDQEFMSVAMQVAAEEADLGTLRLAEPIRDLIDRAKSGKKPQ